MDAARVGRKCADEYSKSQMVYIRGRGVIVVIKSLEPLTYFTRNFAAKNYFSYSTYVLRPLRATTQTRNARSFKIKQDIS